MTRAFHSIVSWQKGPSGYMCWGFPLQKKSQFLHKWRPGMTSACGNFIVETSAFQQRADEGKGPRRALLACWVVSDHFWTYYFGLYYSLYRWTRNNLKWRSCLAVNLCNHTAHVNPHLFIFCLAQCFRITLAMSEKVETRTWAWGQSVLH